MYARSDHTELADLATLLLKISPHAAGVERLWSTMKGVHTDVRNLMKADVATGICAVKMELRSERKKNAERSKSTYQMQNKVAKVIWKYRLEATILVRVLV